MRSILSSASLLLAGVILAAAAFAADPVYKWTDSAGHSHYSQAPPAAGQKYQTITPAGAVSGLSVSVPTTALATTPSADGKPVPPVIAGNSAAQAARQRLCDASRSNVDVLANKKVVSMDLSGKGKAEELTPAQKTEQLDKARQQAAVYCQK